MTTHKNEGSVGDVRPWRNPVRGFAAATVLAVLGAQAQAQDTQVSLRSEAEDITVSGELLAFEDGVYRVRTVIGDISIDGNKVVCTGPGCPAEAEPVEIMTAGVPGEKIILITDNGGVRLEGTLISFDTAQYQIDTALGTFQIDAVGTSCTGPGCPVAQLVPAEKVTQVAAVQPAPEAAPATADPARVPLPASLPAPSTTSTETAPPVVASALVPLAATDDPAALTLSGPASVLEPIFPQILTGLARSRDEEMDVIAPQFVAPDAAAGAGAPSGLLAGTLSSGTGRPSVVLASLSESTETSIEALVEGRADIVFMSAVPGLTDPDDGQTRLLGVDALVAAVHPDNPITALPPSQLGAIFAGTVSNWAQLGGPDLPIDVLAHIETHDMHGALEAALLAPENLSLKPGAASFGTSSALVQALAQRPGAIGFVSRAQAGTAKVLDVLDSCNTPVSATDAALKTRTYPFAREILAQARSTSGLAAEMFAHLGDNDRDLLKNTGLVSLGPLERYSLDSGIDRLERSLGDVTDRFERINISNAIRIMGVAEQLSTVLYFEPGSNRLERRATADLAGILEFADQGDLAELFLVGYSEDTGDASRNRQIGRIEAGLVKRALISADDSGALDETLIRTIGLGAVNPIACDAGGKANELNRRVEIWVRRS